MVLHSVGCINQLTGHCSVFYLHVKKFIVMDKRPASLEAAESGAGMYDPRTEARRVGKSCGEL